MAKDVLAAVGPLASELLDLLAQAQALRLEGRLADASKVEAKAGALMVQGRLASWMVSNFRRKGVDAQTSEDLAQDVWLKLIRMACEGRLDLRGHAIGLLGIMARTRLIDHFEAVSGTAEDPAHRQENTDETQEDKPGFDVDDLPQRDPPDMPLTDCVQRKMLEFAAVAPERAELLQWEALGYTHREVAVMVLKKPLEEVTRKDEGAMRSRLYEARKQAKPYFKECKD